MLRSVAPLLCALLALICRPAAAQTGVLLLYKTLQTDRDSVVVGKNLTLQVTALNVGTGPAYNVVLSEKGYSEEAFEVVETPSDLSFDQIEIGDNVTYTVVIKPKQAGKFKPMQSQVTYVPETDGEEQFGVSTEIPEIVVMTGAQARLKLALFVGKTISLGYFQTVADWRKGAITILVIGGVLLVNFAIVKMRHAMRAQTQKRALRELEE